MHVNTQISRGLERWIAQDEAAQLEGLHGLAGLSCVETFSDLGKLLDEAGFADAGEHVKKLRAEHADACARVRAALPIAVAAQQLEDAGGADVVLSGLFSKIKKAVKKVTKVAAKLSPSHLILKKVAPKAMLLSPSQMLLTAAETKKPKATPEQAAAKAAAKQAKKDARAAKKAAAAAAKAAAAQAAADAAGQSVLANQSGVDVPPALAQQLVASGGGGGGGIIPSESMFTPPTDAGADDGTIFGLPPLVAAGIGAAGLGVLWLAFGRKKH